jgi:hypothetical protein
MAGGQDQKDANQMLREQNTRNNAGTDAFAAGNKADTTASQGRATDLYGSLSGGYGAMANAGREPATPNTPGSGGGGGGAAGVPGSNATFNEASNSYRDFMNKGGGISGAPNTQLNDSEASYRKFMETGGWDPNRVKSMDENIQGLKTFGKTGGIDDASMARMRGGGVYDEFAQTGGLSAGDRGNIRSRATSTIPQFYSNMRDEANRNSTAQGGYGPGQAALMSRMGRGQAGAGADAALNAELGITDQVNKGRLAGAGGMASSENAAMGLKTGNQLAGMTGASNIEQGLQESIRSGQEYGTTGLQSIGDNQRMADMMASDKNAGYRMQGTQGIDQMAQADRQAAFTAQSLGQSGSNAAQAQANWAAQFQQGQKEFGLQGLNSLYSGSGSGEVNQNKTFDLQNRGQGVSQGQSGATALKSGNKSWADYAAPIAGAVTGGLTGGASFLSSIKPKIAPQAAGIFQ